MSIAPQLVHPSDSVARSFDHIRLLGFQDDHRANNRTGTVNHKPRVDWIWDPRNRTPMLVASGVVVLAIALIDWWTKPYFGLGLFYLFPILVAAVYLPRWAIVVLGISSALLSERFSNLAPADFLIRLGFEALALCGCGLLISEALRNRRLSLTSQQRMRALVETSPAAIATVDEYGFIELANKSAAEVFAPRDGDLIGCPIAAFLPELHHALRPESGPLFRASMFCRGRRGNGESFPAKVWFSTCKEGVTPKLVVIVADLREEQSPTSARGSMGLVRVQLNSRELRVLRLIVQGLANKEIAGQISISESGVKNTLQHLFAKAGVRTRSQLVRIALERYRDML